MDKLKELLQDPTWWITVVIAGLIVSTIGAFMKDIISNLLASLSSKYRNWRDARNIEFKRRVEFFAKDDVLLILAYIVCVILLVSFSAILIAMSHFYILWKLEPILIHSIMCIVTSILTFVLYPLIIYTLRLATKATIMYKKEKYPKTP